MAGAVFHIGVLGAETVVNKPDCSEHEVKRSKAKSGTESRQELLHVHFHIPE
ncbi:hypothetical protein [Pedobacter miscanthi]|uniref:hypothetical protein n=1 Tax=Pedobacter miscanthi TaxID=2259170 RepID=UPI00131409CF|nr:hypothetical protein [Pedobacter miscanthi]